MSWKKLFQATIASRRPAARKVSLLVERLEERTVPVIGATAQAAVVSVHSDFDGVVQLASPVRGMGTGSVLYTERHILTAAHLVNSTGLVPVFFQLARNDPIYNVSIHVTIPIVVFGNLPIAGFPRFQIPHP